MAGWASRVYFSDNGSTAIEIAIKMGFRRFSIDHGILTERSSDGSKEKTVELMVHGCSIMYFNYLVS